MAITAMALSAADLGMRKTVGQEPVVAETSRSEALAAVWFSFRIMQESQPSLRAKENHWLVIAYVPVVMPPVGTETWQKASSQPKKTQRV